MSLDQTNMLTINNKQTDVSMINNSQTTIRASPPLPPPYPWLAALIHTPFNAPFSGG